jgi:hypothetical protein
MKKLLYVRLLVISTSFFINAAVFAQSSSEDVAVIGKSSSITFNANTDALALASIKAANSKMYSHFTKNFKDATDLKVHEFDGHVRINFKLHGVSTSTQYNEKGKCQFTISSYDESKLDEEIRESVEANYPGFLVAGTVIEVAVADKSATLVMIENKKEWKRIRINADGMSIYEQYRKQW